MQNKFITRNSNKETKDDLTNSAMIINRVRFLAEIGVLILQCYTFITINFQNQFGIWGRGVEFIKLFRLPGYQVIFPDFKLSLPRTLLLNSIQGKTNNCSHKTKFASFIYQYVSERKFYCKHF